jgi:hypothetical protein
MNLDAFSPFRKRANSTKKEKELEFGPVITKIPQPVKSIPIIDIYLSNRA